MNKMLKNGLSLLLACLMIMSIATVAFAENGTLTVGTATGKAGEDVVIPVTLNADGVTSGVFKISYDKDVLTYKSATTATFGAYTIDAETAGTIKFAFANNGTAVAADKALITVKFTINAGTAAGTYSNAVSVEREEADDDHHLKADGFFDANGNEVAVSITAGGVTVEATAPAFAKGDVNGDNKVNSNDAYYLLKYVFDNESYPLSVSGDVNGDNKVNSNDAYYLLKYVFDNESYPLA